MSPSFFSKTAVLSLLLSFGGLTAAVESPFEGLKVVKRTPTPQGEPTSLKVTSQNAPLRRIKVANSTGSARPRGYGKSGLQDIYQEDEWAVDVNLGGQEFTLIIDTGSSDLWVAQEGFRCVNGTDAGDKPESACKFGPLHTGNYTEGEANNRNFNIEYADLQFLFGTMGYTSVKVAGVTVDRQLVAFVNEAYWKGDGITSGLMGLAYTGLTSEFIGNKPLNDNWNVTGKQPGDNILYPPIVQTMINNGDLGAPVFSLALQRSSQTSNNVPGGYIAFGGLPPVSFDPVFTSVPIEIYQFHYYPNRLATVPSFYTIAVEGYTYPNKGSTTPTLHNNTKNGIVDSGTTLLYLPTTIYNGYLASFDPPAARKGDYAFYPCTATVPSFGINIGGTVFNISNADMLLPDSGYINKTNGVEYCVLGVANGGEGYNAFPIFGDVFLKNVVAVFDIGASMMRFAAHNY